MGPTTFLVKMKLTWIKDLGLSLSLHEDFPANLLKIRCRTKVHYLLVLVSYGILSHYCNFLLTLLTRDDHTSLRFVTTCDTGVFNGGLFMHLSIFFPVLLVDIKLP